jgi:predicted MFS family arabinose efflux permease
MFKSIGRNNQLFMLGNFIFALSIGLWLNLRPLYLADLGANPEQIGLALAVGGLAGGIIPLPAGILSDRIGPRRVIVMAWMLALAGTMVMALAQTWEIVALGIFISNLTWAANPAVTSFVLLSMPEELSGENSEKVLSIVFRAWPAAMIFAPALGGWIADLFSIRMDLWVSVAGFTLAAIVMLRATEVKAENGVSNLQFASLVRNKIFWILAIFFGLLTIAQYIGFTLIPNYLEDTRGFSQGTIGILFSVSFMGTLGFNLIIERLRPRQGFLLLMTVSFVAFLILWGLTTSLWAWVALFLLGSISTMWIVKIASIGRVVDEDVQGLAFGVTESITFLAMSVAAWVAGILYGLRPSHEAPLIVSFVSIPLVFLMWLFFVKRVTGEPPK